MSQDESYQLGGDYCDDQRYRAQVGAEQYDLSGELGIVSGMRHLATRHVWIYPLCG